MGSWCRQDYPDRHASKQEAIEIRGSDSFMFASFAEELGTGSYDRVGGARNQ